MSLYVQKFGGTSVADIERIRNVARRVAKTYDQGNDVVVVVSAMAGITDNLIRMAEEVTPTPSKRELDMLLATGEQTSAALLAITLQAMGYKAVSFLGHQAEVCTDRAFGNARILEIGAGRIRESIAKKKIVVIAGFQGADPVCGSRAVHTAKGGYTKQYCVFQGTDGRTFRAEGFVCADRYITAAIQAGTGIAVRETERLCICIELAEAYASKPYGCRIKRWRVPAEPAA